MKNLDERDVDYILNILDHCDRISEAIARFGNNIETFLQDSDYRDVIKMNLFQIGEISNHLTDQCKEQFSEIPWHKIYGIRNIIAHAYVKIDDEIIWQTATVNIPELKQLLENMGE